MAKLSKENALLGVQTGIIKAHENYEDMAGISLYYAPEYLVTVSIANKIKSLGECWVTLEGNVDETIRLSGSKRTGRPRSTIRKDGRFDVVLWFANGVPRAVIEVKHPLYLPTDAFRKDILRMRDVLVSNRKAGGSIEFCSLGFWMDAENPQRKHQSPEHRIQERYDRLVEEAKTLVSKESDITVRLSEQPIIKPYISEAGEPCAWAACCITLE